MNRFFIACILSLTLLSACYAAKRPGWIRSEPTDREYYYGVGAISKSLPGYRDIARETALKNISLQINVQINAELLTTETEISGISRSQFLSSIQSSTVAILDDVELFQSFEDKKTFYACYRINKAHYHAKREARKAVAMNQALDLLAKYDAREADLTQRIGYLLDGLGLLESFVDLDLNARYNGKVVHLYNELIFRLKDLPAIISLEVTPNNPELVIERQSRTTYTVVAKEKDGMPCSAFPLIVDFARGAGDISAEKLTDKDGKLYLHIERITSFEPNQAVAIRIDKDYYLQNIKSNTVKDLFSRLAFGEATLTINALKPRVYLKYNDESSTGEEGIKKISGAMLDLDLSLADSQEKANYLLSVQITCRDGIYIKEVESFTSFAIIKITLVDTADQTVLYSDSFDTVKGAGKTKELARQKALQAARNYICDEVLYTNVHIKIYP